MGAEHESSHQTGDSATVAVGGAPAGAVEGLTGVPGLGLASAIGNAAFSALVTGSGTAAGAAARLMRQPKPEPEPEDADPDAARKKEFGERTFSKAVHEPPTGGRFGITYRPGAGQLTVAVRVLFDWQDFPEAQASKDEKPYCKWTADEKERWSSEFCARIAARWSEKHAIRCTKPGWEEFTANPVVKVEPVGGGAAHFTVRVHKDIGGIGCGRG